MIRVTFVRRRRHQQKMIGHLRQRLAEPVGVSLVSMAMGKPVVATANGGNADIVCDGETGIYVPPMDADAMRDAIKRLLDDPELSHNMGNRARAVVEQGLNLETYVQNVADIVMDASPRKE